MARDREKKRAKGKERCDESDRDERRKEGMGMRSRIREKGVNWYSKDRGSHTSLVECVYICRQAQLVGVWSLLLDGMEEEFEKKIIALSSEKE
jgi:hypothetical protein